MRDQDPRFVFVFVDGLGLGRADSPDNPLCDSELNILANFHAPAWSPPDDGGRPPSLPEILRHRPLPFGGIVIPTDPSLGINGLPQSATGQTTILTGQNAALVLGRHMYGYPTRTLQKMLLKASILKRLATAGISATFANAFRPIFFELGEKVWERPLSATTWANRAAGLPFRTFQELEDGKAVYQDITHDTLMAKKFPATERSPETAGEILAGISRDFALTFFEFFQTDKAGHARKRDKAVYELRKLERFLSSLLESLDLKGTTVVLTSDHGNVEHLGTKSHTHNTVPTLLFGAGQTALEKRLDRLEYFTPVLLKAIGLPKKN